MPRGLDKSNLKLRAWRLEKEEWEVSMEGTADAFLMGEGSVGWQQN